MDAPNPWRAYGCEELEGSVPYMDAPPTAAPHDRRDPAPFCRAALRDAQAAGDKEAAAYWRAEVARLEQRDAYPLRPRM